MPNKVLADVKYAIRQGYAWPGGYRLNVILYDGSLLCRRCAYDNFSLIARATLNDRGGWQAIGTGIHWEGDNERCAECYCDLPSEYGPVDR
jgi:hypothetical protein